MPACGDPRARLVKCAAARVNVALGNSTRERGEAIVRAAQEIIDGKLDGNFPLVVWQTGSGTQTNMNANEVIANRAIEMLGGEMGSKSPVHPNDMSTKVSRQTIPFRRPCTSRPSPKSTGAAARPRRLREALDEKAKSFARHRQRSAARICMDATPVTLGQEFSGYTTQIGYGIARVEAALPRLYRLAQGGTAVGTGLNRHPNSRSAFRRRSRRR